MNRILVNLLKTLSCLDTLMWTLPPDLNNSRDANLKFIEINRAYNNLCNNMQNFEEASFEDLVKRRYYEKYVNNKSFEKSYGLDISFRTKVAWAVIFYIVLSVVFAIGGVYFLLILNQVL